MAAPKGNTYWTRRRKHGRDPIYSDPEDLWNDCVEYFEWVEENPLKEEKVFHTNGKVTRAEVPKMRAMSISALCLWIGIDDSTWYEYAKKEDFSDVTTRAERVIYSQKFEGAAAEFLNANIIARDLGLKDKQETEHSGQVTNTIKVSYVEAEQEDNETPEG